VVLSRCTEHALHAVQVFFLPTAAFLWSRIPQMPWGRTMPTTCEIDWKDGANSRIEPFHLTVDDFLLLSKDIIPLIFFSNLIKINFG